jgi:hypothetical protein
MPADGVLEINLAYARGSLRISLPAYWTTAVAPAYHSAAPEVAAVLRDALRHPVSGPPLREVVRLGQRVAAPVCDAIELAAAGPQARVCGVAEGPFVAAQGPMLAAGVR